MNTNEPILIADGVRGIYAPMHAAKQLVAMMGGNRWDLANINTADLLMVANVDPSEVDGEQAEELASAWDNVVRNLEAHSPVYGRNWFVIENDGDIFLAPEGYDMEQA